MVEKCTKKLSLEHKEFCTTGIKKEEEGEERRVRKNSFERVEEAPQLPFLSKHRALHKRSKSQKGPHHARGFDQMQTRKKQASKTEDASKSPISSS